MYAAIKILKSINGPSVKNGADAARIPPLKPFVNVSLITVVRSGPGLTPSTTPKVIPAKASPMTKSASMAT